jgi:hypothetical protein
VPCRCGSGGQGRFLMASRDDVPEEMVGRRTPASCDNRLRGRKTTTPKGISYFRRSRARTVRSNRSSASGSSREPCVKDAQGCATRPTTRPAHIPLYDQLMARRWRAMAARVPLASRRQPSRTGARRRAPRSRRSSTGAARRGSGGGELGDGQSGEAKASRGIWSTIR